MPLIFQLLIIQKSLKHGLDGYEQLFLQPHSILKIKKLKRSLTLMALVFRVVKGAVQTIMALCGEINAETLAEVNNAIDGFSKKGSRTIAVAETTDEHSSFF